MGCCFLNKNVPTHRSFFENNVLLQTYMVKVNFFHVINIFFNSLITVGINCIFKFMVYLFQEAQFAINTL